ncbi:hypothetical protein J4430_03275 [Candidatus Woesearchaeota archaeon]|nr:hypothetical protein [Candidatus Woesearchaeota archaeon]
MDEENDYENNKWVTDTPDTKDNMDFYEDESIGELMEEDEISDLEEGFMQGYNEGEGLAKCPVCKKVIGSDFVEEEFDGKIYRFCSEEHAEVFEEKRSKGQ